MRRRRLAGFAAALVVLACWPAAALAAPFWPVSGQTLQARSISWLFWLVMAIAGLFLLVVLGTLLYVIVAFRGREGQPDPRPVYGHLRLEMWWAGIPFAILVAVFIFTVREVGVETAIAPDALPITLIGHQWWWEFQYPGAVSANELHVPVGRQVRLQLLSADVVHNFWVPELAGKEQMVPGQTNLWTFTPEQPGRYDGACAEYCGTQHGWMRLTVFADAPADFDRWLAGQGQPVSQQVLSQHQDALRLYTANACGACHAISGVSNGKAAPDLTHLGSRSTIGAGVLQNTPDNLAAWIQDAQQFKPGSYMPKFRLSDADARQLAAFLEDLR